MVTYKVTTELKTSWWIKILRFFRLKKKREEFKLQFEKAWYLKGDIIRSSGCDILILGYGK